MNEDLYRVLRQSWRAKDDVLQTLMLPQVHPNQDRSSWEYINNKALLNLVHQNEDLIKQVQQAKKEATDWQSQARGKEELVKEVVEAQSHILLLQKRLSRAHSALLDRRRKLLDFKLSNAVISSWQSYLCSCRQRKVLNRAEKIWNSRVLANWFSNLQYAVSTVKIKRQIFEKVVFRLNKQKLLQSFFHWKVWARNRKVLCEAYAHAMQLRERRFLRKIFTSWVTICCESHFHKSLQKKAMMMVMRCRLQKAWRSWYLFYATSLDHRDGAEHLYARNRIYIYFNRWKCYSASKASKFRQSISSLQLNEISLKRKSFSGWLSKTRHHIVVVERLTAFLARHVYRFKKIMLKFWFESTLRTKEKRAFRISLKTKKENKVKESFLSQLLCRRSQKHIINKFLFRQSMRRRFQAFTGWIQQVIQHRWCVRWTLSKRKSKDIYNMKRSIFAWLLYNGTIRTHAALDKQRNLEGSLDRITLELKEFKALKFEWDTLYSSLKSEKLNAKMKFNSTAKRFLPLLEARLQWTIIPHGTGSNILPRAGHSSVEITCTVGTKAASFIVIFGGYNGITSYSDVFCFDTDSKVWKTPRVVAENGNAFPRPTWDHAACSYGNKMIAFGGFDGHLQSSVLSILSFENIDSCSWLQPKQSMGASPSAVSQHTCCIYDEGKYMAMFGGYSAYKGHSNELWILDLHLISWTSPECFGTPPSPRRGHGAAVINKKMYVIGGFDGKAHLSDVHVLDLQSWTWNCLSTQGSGPSPRRHHALESVGNHLVIYGGFDGDAYLEDVYSLDISTNIWKPWNALKPQVNPTLNIGRVGTKFARSLHTMTFSKNRLIIFGGVHGKDPLQDTLILENTAGSSNTED
ncbi:hypothetical protein KP509_32G048800 [Ceratopteris richardii]|uniref:Uncharacterized protein n=1 Tax=Ceratopteris richardii TaxID=49495 RepID=A0A8T2QTP5_CERRI|nr:hypothetical protein KP509_32G048800 [Ceratopteris richardii]